MTTTAADLIRETSRYLYASARTPLNVLSGAHNDTTTTFTFVHELGAIQAGALLAVDLEMVYVVSIDTLGKTATVIRAQQGSTAATHDGSTVYVNPQFSDFAVFQSLNAELDDLSSPIHGLYQIASLNVTYEAATEGYDLTAVTGLIDVLDVKYDEPGPAKRWPNLRWRLKRESSTTDFASGFALVLLEAAHPGNPVRVTYSKPFTAFANAASTITATGLPATAHDIPPLGAAARLQVTREGQRNFNETQSDTRRAQEVPPGAQINSARGLLQLRADRIRAEAARLERMFPRRRKGL